MTTRQLWFATALFASACGAPDMGARTNATSFALANEASFQISFSRDRSHPFALNESIIVTGAAYAFVTGVNINRVEFYKPDSTSAIHAVENYAAWDFNTTADDGTARPYDFSVLAEGRHTLSARVVFRDGSAAVVSASFTRSSGPQPLRDDFVGANGGPLSSLWSVRGDWKLLDGTAYNRERGYGAWVISAASFPHTTFVIESRAFGFGRTQGPSPSDTVSLVFGGDAYNSYRLTYQVWANNLSLSRLTIGPTGEFERTALAQTTIALDPTAFHRFKVVRVGAQGSIEVFVGTDAGYPAVATLSAFDSHYPSLQQFGWVLDSESPGDFKVDWLKAP